MQAVSAAPVKAAGKTRLFFPLRLKLVFLILATLAPLGLYLYLETGKITGEAYLMGSLAFGLIGFVFGVVLGDVVLVESARGALFFFRKLRAEEFASVPVLPRVGSDEIGEIVRQMGYAAAHFAHLRSESEEALELKSLFLITAAHQLRTPLTELTWAMDDLRRQDAPQGEREQLLKSVDSTLKRMHLVIEHILASARVGEGKFGYVFAPVDLLGLFQKIVTEIAPISERHRVPVSLSQKGLFPVIADAERISLVIFDLVANALQYTPEGGSVVLSAEPKGADIEVAVTDSGIGITPAERANLFNKFYRGDRARHMHPDGTGLGLYLARAIVQEHGSDISIESQEGKGTRMSFLLHSKKELAHR